MPDPNKTTIRLPRTLGLALAQTADREGVSQDELVERVVRAYLGLDDPARLREEAQRQSLLAREQDVQDDTWEQNADSTGWKS